MTARPASASIWTKPHTKAARYRPVTAALSTKIIELEDEIANWRLSGRISNASATVPTGSCGNPEDNPRSTAVKQTAARLDGMIRPCGHDRGSNGWQAERAPARMRKS
jgi:hypothetical protein